MLPSWTQVLRGFRKLEISTLVVLELEGSLTEAEGVPESADTRHWTCCGLPGKLPYMGLKVSVDEAQSTGIYFKIRRLLSMPPEPDLAVMLQLAPLGVLL